MAPFANAYFCCLCFWYAFGVPSKETLPRPGSRNFFPMFSSISFHTFESHIYILNPFWVNLCESVREGSNCFLLYGVTQFAPRSLLILPPISAGVYMWILLCLFYKVMSYCTLLYYLEQFYIVWPLRILPISIHLTQVSSSLESPKYTTTQVMNDHWIN